MSASYLIGQILGIFVFGIGIALFLLKDDQRFKGVMAANSLLAALHLALIGAFSGALVSVVTAIRVGASRYKKLKWLGGVFVVGYIAAGIFQAQTPLDWAPSIACILGTIGMYFLSGISMRFLILVGTLLWLSYYTVVLSWGGIVGESFILVVNSITIWRLHRDKTLDERTLNASN